jgi:hypothetical protein
LFMALLHRGHIGERLIQLTLDALG